MVRLCFLILTNAALLMSRMRPEPPETNFFLTSIPLITGLQSSVVFFTNSYSTRPEPLCLKNDDYRSASANLLAHKLCTEAKFSTFLQASLVSSDSALGHSSEISTYSELSCHQDDYYDIVCNRSSSSNSGSCSLLQVTCGACHKHVSLQPNSSLQLMSPLYPVLQPGQVCQYDLQLAQGVSADITLEITDLSLAPAKPSHSGVYCVASFLHILSGQSFSELESLATLCGEVYYPARTSYYRVTDSVVRLMLVSGADDGALGRRRGFLLNIHVSPAIVKIPLQRLLIFLSFFGFLILVCVLMSSVLIYLNSKSKARVVQPRRRQTWHGSLARPGESLHQVRTERIRQLGSSWSRNSWGSDNLYMFDNRVSRRLPQLPAFNFTSDDINHRAEDEDPGFKVYETISLQSRSPDRVLDEAIANTEKKFSVNSLQCPPPLPTRPSLLAEKPYSSPLYLSLPGCYTEVVDSGDTSTITAITDREDISVEETAVDTVESSSYPEETSHPAGRSITAKHGFSVLMERIRSISLTECSEDETNLIDRDIECGEGG